MWVEISNWLSPNASRKSINFHCPGEHQTNRKRLFPYCCDCVRRIFFCFLSRCRFLSLSLSLFDWIVMDGKSLNKSDIRTYGGFARHWQQSPKTERTRGKLSRKSVFYSAYTCVWCAFPFFFSPKVSSTCLCMCVRACMCGICGCSILNRKVALYELWTWSDSSFHIELGSLHVPDYIRIFQDTHTHILEQHNIKLWFSLDKAWEGRRKRERRNLWIRNMQIQQLNKNLELLAQCITNIMIICNCSFAYTASWYIIKQTARLRWME